MQRHLLDAVFSAVLRANLKYPNIWECIDVTTGELARSNAGYYSTPCMSSNVGAGELLGTIWLYHGFDMFGTRALLPLTAMRDYHYAGLRITVTEDCGKFTITAKSAEVNESDITFTHPDGRNIKIHLECGKAVVV